ncbi:MAG TPA: thioredoxin [Actinomycetota bacterium]|jgi:putative thioredoxin
MNSVIEVTDQTFMRDVVEESNSRPVVVDFWAEWCAPCRMIGPVLERLAGEGQGRFLLAKLDVDANPEAATAFRIQSIPAVKAFRDGQVVEEFVGAIPEDAIRAFLDAVTPSEADDVVAEAEGAEREGRTEDAEVGYRRALELAPGHAGATLGLARLAAGRGDPDEARRLLEPLRPDPEAERILVTLEVSSWGAGANGDGDLAAAERAAADGRFDDALRGFLDQVRAGGDSRDAAREAMLKIFSILGDDDPLTREYRPKLAAALF